MCFNDLNMSCCDDKGFVNPAKMLPIKHFKNVFHILPREHFFMFCMKDQVIAFLLQIENIIYTELM